MDRNKQAFYRPTGQRRFFVDLEDVLCHAERWQREFGWKKVKADVKKEKPAEVPVPDDGLSLEDRLAILRGEE